MNSLRRHARSKAAAAMLALAGVVCWIGCDGNVRSLPASDPNPPPGATASTSPPPASAPHPDPSLGRINPETASRLLALEAQEAEADRTIWAAEIQAARCGAVFDALWDQLNASTSRWEVLRRFDPGALTLPGWETPRPEVHGILVHAPKTVESPVSATTWATLTERWAETGWSLLQCEFRHVRFDTNSAGLPDRSRFAFSAHFVRAQPEERAVLEGPLEVAWRVDTDAAGLPRIESIDARRLELRTRPGPAAFRTVLSESISPGRLSPSIDPVLAHDLDRDGFPELLLVARNLLFRRAPEGNFRSEPISPALSAVVYAAILGRFDADPYPDLLCQTLRSLELLPGLPDGRFAPAFRRAWTPPADVQAVMTLTAGDIDDDGDVDAFLGQYKEPYVGGSSPTPYHDANDGYPAFLLRNDGNGRFEDVTIAAGLEAKRRRRMYSASFADLDHDGRLDLLTTSDFAGLDLFRNEGSGRFSDVTAAWAREPNAFGMAHALADFDADGRLDLLMIGMPSPTVDRLEHLGTVRPGSPQDPRRRTAMTRGNRLYLARADGGFHDGGELGQSIARSGWSWGCAAADFDNDGFPDVAIGNGMESKATVRDYESEYWLHDQHVGTSEEDPVTYLYYKSKIARTRGSGWSYGGYEKNRLYLNRSGRRFFEAGHLLGVALEQDTRNVLSEDMDADGKPDLVVVSFEKWPEPKPTLRIFGNGLADTGRWIGFRLPGARPGTRVTIRHGGRVQTRQIVAGDSYRSQHSEVVHFGLGTSEGVDEAVLEGPGNKKRALAGLASNRYYRIAEGGFGPISGTE